jgi:hypothetical protein
MSLRVRRKIFHRGCSAATLDLHPVAADRNPLPRRRGAKSRHHAPTGQTMASEPEDFTTMSDPDFLAERRRVRDQLEHLPGQSVDHARLAALRAAMDEEFDRRARAAWSAAD